MPGQKRQNLEEKVRDQEAEIAALQREIAERGRATDALREGEQKLGMALKAANAGAWAWDVTTNQMQWSEELYAVFGFAPNAFASTSYEGWLSLVHPDDRDRVAAEVAQVLEQKTDLKVEYRVVYPDGCVRWISARGQLLGDDSSRPARMVGIAMDITERKQAEAERERLLDRERHARAEAEAANRAKDEFLAVVSHELRAPLNAMLGWARILRCRKVDEDTLAHAIETIERSARSQSKLIEDLLDTARITAGKLQLSMQPVDLAEVIRAALSIVRPAAEAKAIDIREEIDASADVVSGDPDRLQQVVWNLLANAIKFTPNGGRVVVRLERVDPHAQITVSDTGRGISAEFLPYVFDRFHQADTSSTRKHGGLGLGLALAQNIVELHGGTVAAESPGEGRGATFTVNLPLRAVRAAATAEESASFWHDAPLNFPPLLDGLWALVVDDEADARDLVTTLLQQYGATVTSACSAAEALAALTKGESGRRPDVLISDIGMPDEDGYLLIRRVRELGPERGGQIPAIALTAYGRAIDRIRALSAGFQMHIPKPVEPAELAMVIISLTGRAGRGMKA